MWCREKSNRAILLFAQGHSVKDVARAVGLSVPTFRKVYFSEVAARAEMALRVEALQLGRLNAAAESGNVGAERELFKRLEKGRERVAAAVYAAPPPSQKAKKKGKKEELADAAASVRGLYEAPPPPDMLN